MKKNKKNATHVIFWAGFLRRHLKENLILSNKPPPSHGTNVSYQQCIIWDGWVVNGWMVEYIIEHEVKEENKLILFFNIAKPAHFS